MGRAFFWLGQSRLGQFAFTLFIEKITDGIRASIARERQRRQILIDAKKSMELLKNATSKDSVDAATDNALDTF